MDELLNKISQLTEISTADIRSKQRDEKIVAVRHIFWYICYLREFSTAGGIGKYTGHDRSTVQTALKKIKFRIRSDKYFRELLAKCLAVADGITVNVVNYDDKALVFSDVENKLLGIYSNGKLTDLAKRQWFGIEVTNVHKFINEYETKRKKLD